METIRRSQARERRYPALRFAGKTVSRVAVVFLVVAIAFSVPFCTVSAFRDATLGYVLRTFNTGADISLYGVSAPQPYLGGGHPTRFPGGSWILTETTRDDSMYLVKYEDVAGDCIEYTKLTASGSGITIDSSTACRSVRSRSQTERCSIRARSTQNSASRTISAASSRSSPPSPRRISLP